MLRLNRVTITGADDNTDIDQLLSLHNDFPFIEYAILFSPKRQGTARYPSLDWVSKFTSAVSNSFSWEHRPNFAAHLCGTYTRDILLKGDILTFRDLMDCRKGLAFSLWNRIQLNLGNRPLPDPELKNLFNAIHSLCLFSDSGNTNKQYIMGGSQGYVEEAQQLCSKWKDLWDKPQFLDTNSTALEDSLVVSLFDASGGRGLETKNWPEYQPPYCGFAGGLNPENVARNIENILKQDTNGPFWIDVESGVRDKQDILNLQLVQEFLVEAHPFIAKKLA